MEGAVDIVAVVLRQPLAQVAGGEGLARRDDGSRRRPAR